MATEAPQPTSTRFRSPVKLAVATSPYVAPAEAMWGLTPGQVWPTSQSSRKTARRGFRKRCQ